MAKQGQHKHDDNDQRVSKGPNNPSKSVEITTGSPKKEETYEKQAREHKDPAAPAQHDKNEWQEDTREDTRNPDGTLKDGKQHRSGSASNPGRGSQHDDKD